MKIYKYINFLALKIIKWQDCQKKKRIIPEVMVYLASKSNNKDLSIVLWSRFSPADLKNEQLKRFSHIIFNISSAYFFCQQVAVLVKVKAGYFSKHTQNKFTTFMNDEIYFGCAIALTIYIFIGTPRPKKDVSAVRTFTFQ